MAELSIEQQRALALARARKRASEAQGSAHPQATGFQPGVDWKRQATDVLGRVNKPIVGAADFLTPGIDLAGAARKGGMAVAEGPPETLGQSMAEGAGLAATALIPTVGVAQKVGQAASGPVGQAIGSIAKPFVEAPLRTTAMELGIGTAMGGGGHLGETKAQDIGMAPETGRVIGETVAGLGAAGLAAPFRSADAVLSHTPGIGFAWRIAKRNLGAFTKTGARQRAHDQITRQSGRVGEDIEALSQPDEFGLSPAQRTGNPRIMQMERTLRDVDPAFDFSTQEQIENSHRLIREGVENMTEGATAQEAATVLRGARQVLEGDINRAVAEAERQAGLRMAELAPDVPREEAAKIYREELEKAYKAAGDLNRSLWGDVADDVVAPTANAKAAYQRFMESDASATLRNMPEIAEQYLAPGRNTAFGDEASVKELQGLRSELLQIARNARTGSGSTPRNDKTARYASDLADAIEADIESLGDTVSVPLRIAREHTRLMKEKFRQGTVGDILGLKRTGAAAVAPELTLSSLDRKGVQAAVSVDELRAAGVLGAGSRAARGGADAGEMPQQVAGLTDRGERALRDYLQQRFVDYASPRGEYNPDRAIDFLRENEELLNRVPDFKRQLTEATEGALFSRHVRAEADTGLKEARDTPGGRFTDERKFGREFETLRTPQEARALLAEAKRRDPSGRAVAGVKDAAIDFLIGPDINPRQFVKRMAEPKGQVARAVLGNDELARLNKIVETAKTLDQADRVSASSRSLMTDAPAQTMKVFAYIVGAKAGRSLNTGTIQAPGRMAGFFTRVMERLTADKAEKLLADAVKDGDLMKSLMISPNLPPSRVPKALRAWLTANVGMQFGDDEAARLPQERRSGLSGRAEAATSPNVSPQVTRRHAALERRLGASLPVKSGYRSPEENQRVGGAEKSRHMEGDALDLDVSALSKRERLKLIAEASRLGFSGIGVYDNTIHLDMGAKRAWGPSHKRESVPHWAEAVVRGHINGRFAAQ